ncbi:MAG: ATP-dependent zinc metalloprotease FtsH [Planctomycetes bacterium]|nr:ATP-dependent zinc metalloprotease FtsH [Planctomycetota bacterium]
MTKKTPSRKKNDLPSPGGLPPRYNRSPFTWLLIALVIMTIFMSISQMHSTEELTFSEYDTYVEQGHVEKVMFKESTREITGKFNEQGIANRPDGAPTMFRVYYTPELLREGYFDWLRSKGVEVDIEREGLWIQFLMSLVPFLLVIGLIYFIFLRNLKGGGMLMNFGRSRHRVRGKEKKVTFDDVAGIDEAKEEVAEIIEFLKNPKKFMKIGGRIPRGVLLSGPPGCGKTLLAKAIAGEADVPFFSIAGSDFVEMFVGVGASRVRDLFRQAKENSPCIIFLDEIDAIGKRRGPGVISGGHDEREQTLNAILVEMDGFETNDQVIVIAATNRADILDPALTRPGRFDRQVVVPLPDLQGRMKILQIHAKKIKYDPSVDFERLARGTPMFTGAELEALINEAAIAATMQGKDRVEMSDLEEARDKVRWGRAKRSRVMDESDKRLIAFHEAGHALVQAMSKDADPLHKVSIIPRGPMGGATFALPEKDRLFYSKKYCLAQLQICFGGRVAEELFCDDITSGAQSDIKQATMLARGMIMEWGMGEEVGPINYVTDGSRDGFFGHLVPEYSQRTAELIDQEVKKLIDSAYVKVKDLLEAHHEKLHALADALLKHETLDADEVKTIIEGGEFKKPTVSDLLAAEQKKTSDLLNATDLNDDDWLLDDQEWEDANDTDEDTKDSTDSEDTRFG